MKKRLLSVLLAVSLIMSSSMTVFATEVETEPETVPEVEVQEEVLAEDQEDALEPEVQAAYDAFGKIKAALESKDFNALESAIAEFENAGEKLTEAQDEMLTDLLGEELFEVIFTAALVIGMDEMKEDFLADKNAENALLYVESYKLYVIDKDWGEEEAALVLAMIPDAQSVYEEALNYLPTQNVLDVYYAYAEIELMVWMQYYDEDFIAAYEGFEAVLDAFNELTEEELGELAQLIGEEDAEAAYSAVLSTWITANVVKEMGSLYDAFYNDPSKENAKAYVEYYDSIYNDPAYVDEELRANVEGFFVDIHDVYEEAKALAGDSDKTAADAEADDKANADGKEDNKAEVVIKDASPKTGDTTSVIWPMAGMFAAIAAIVIVKKKRA